MLIETVPELWPEHKFRHQLGSPFYEFCVYTRYSDNPINDMLEDMLWFTHLRHYRRVQDFASC